MIRPMLTPTLSLITESRRAIDRAQQGLVRAETELATGRLADLETSLGFRIGASVALRREEAHLTAIRQSNATVRLRIAASEVALASVAETAQNLRDTLLGTASGQLAPSIVAAEARQGLAGLVAALNTTVDGVHILAGLNTDVAPMTDYFADGSASRTVVAAAFTGALGFAQDDPGVAALSSAQVQAFLDGPFDALFEPAGWTGTWTDASDRAVRNRIAPDELIETSVTAHAAPLREIVKAFVMIADLGIAGMNADARDTVMTSAISVLAEAGDDLADLRAGLGHTTTRIDAADDRMTVSIDMMAAFRSSEEDVDPAEVANRIASLTRDLETAYAMTARLHRLSLLDAL
jgi:flagellar hook-associated protein 3 FlgL